MLWASFEGWILKRYGLYDVVSNAYKYVHCDLIDTTRYFITITLDLHLLLNFLVI